MQMLDRFEDSLYERNKLGIVSLSRGEIEAYAYVGPKNLEHNLANEAWDPKVFEDLYLDQYVEMCGRFRVEKLKEL